jgi:hypothetical protein
MTWLGFEPGIPGIISAQVKYCGVVEGVCEGNGAWAMGATSTATANAIATDRIDRLRTVDI